MIYLRFKSILFLFIDALVFVFEGQETVNALESLVDRGNP